MGKLSATAVKAATHPGRLGDGDGLFLIVQPGGSKSWMVRVQKNGNRRDFGLGSAAKVPLALARDTISAPTVLAWCIAHAALIPIQAIGAIVKLVEIQFFTMMGHRELGQATARMLFGWLMQLDLRETAITIPTAEDAPRLYGDARQTMIEDLRTMALLMAVHAPEAAKA